MCGKEKVAWRLFQLICKIDFKSIFPDLVANGTSVSPISDAIPLISNAQKYVVTMPLTAAEGGGEFKSYVYYLTPCVAFLRIFF